MIKGIIKTVSEPKEWIGKMQIGFTLQEDPKKWYNVDGELDVLKELKETLVSPGNEISFEYDKGKVGDITLIKKGQPKQKESKSWADDMTNYEDLLNAAHEKCTKDGFYLSMESRPVRDSNGPLVNFKDKTALYEATLTITDKKGLVIQRITDTGDAEGIGNENIKPHFNRMASTRAMARCYRIYTNNAKVAEEETGE